MAYVLEDPIWQNDDLEVSPILGNLHTDSHEGMVGSYCFYLLSAETGTVLFLSYRRIEQSHMIAKSSLQ